MAISAATAFSSTVIAEMEVVNRTFSLGIFSINVANSDKGENSLSEKTTMANHRRRASRAYSNVLLEYG